VAPRNIARTDQNESRRKHERSFPPVSLCSWSRVSGWKLQGSRVGCRGFGRRSLMGAMFCDVCDFDGRDIPCELVSLSSDGHDQPGTFRVASQRLA